MGIAFNFDNSYARLSENFFTRIAPLPAAKPEIVIINHELGKKLGLNLQKESDETLANLFSGSSLPDGAEPIAQAYAGHQFGNFVILGDGRAHLLGEHITPDGKRVDIQFKGSGRTPYARRGDGRAALGPMLREYIISETMHALGIPTTLSLAVVKTGDFVYRETKLQGAILTRVASSHIRVGTFEYLAAQKDIGLLKELADYAIARHYPELADSDQPYADLVHSIMKRQISLVVEWLRVGFIHGVMNTDNMSISGETIDYGPCAFMDEYDPNTVFSSIDSMGRYAYANQPNIAQWNIARLAEALLPLIHPDIDKSIDIAEGIINQFQDIYQSKWLTMMRSKLGLFGDIQGDFQLISDLLDWMQSNKADYTNTFYYLSQSEKPSDKLYHQKAFEDWYLRWQLRLKQNTKPRKSALCLMKSNNPVVIARNHKVEEALATANQGDFQALHNLLSVVNNPYKNEDIPSVYQQPPTPNERVYQTFCGT